LKTFDRLRREAGRRERCRLCVLHVLQPANIATIQQMFDFSAEVGADEIIFEKGYGITDINTKEKILPTTLFNVGSISKTFVANTILILASERKSEDAN